jgi:hypothetical protein
MRQPIIGLPTWATNSHKNSVVLIQSVLSQGKSTGNLNIIFMSALFTGSFKNISGM